MITPVRTRVRTLDDVLAEMGEAIEARAMCSEDTIAYLDNFVDDPPRGLHLATFREQELAALEERITVLAVEVLAHTGGGVSCG